MSDRDELAQVICDACEDDASEVPYDVRAADAVIAAGWRKKPSRDELVEAIENSGAWNWSQTVADVVLALLDGPTETGEK